MIIQSRWNWPSFILKTFITEGEWLLSINFTLYWQCSRKCVFSNLKDLGTLNRLMVRTEKSFSLISQLSPMKMLRDAFIHWKLWRQICAMSNSFLGDLLVFYIKKWYFSNGWQLWCDQTVRWKWKFVGNICNIYVKLLWRHFWFIDLAFHY